MAMSSEQAREVREQLLPYNRRRVEVEGTVTRVGTFWDAKARMNVPAVCVGNLEIREGDHPVVDHVWVSYADLMLKAGVVKGDTVRFTAQVYEYHHKDAADPNKVTSRCGLREPRDLRGLNRELAPPDDGPVLGGAAAVRGETRALVRIADGADLTARGEGQVAEGDGGDDVREPAPALTTPAPAPAVDPRVALFNPLLDLVRAHGLARVRKTLDAVALLEDQQ